MRILSMVSSCVLGLALVSSACGGDDDGGGGGATYDTQREAFTAFARASCERLDECDMLEGMTVDQCTTTVVDFVCAEEEADCDGALPTGVTSEEINTCIDALDDVACDAEDPPAACEGIGAEAALTAARTTR
jgi:hypothetical protein